MQRRPEITRSIVTSALAAAAVLTSGCASDPLRSVVEVVPVEVSYSFEFRGEGDAPGWPGPDGATVEGESIEGVQPWHMLELCGLEEPSDESEWAVVVAVVDVFGVLGSSDAGAQQLNPELGPVDLGYPLLVDLGAGEAPYDDGVPTIHGVEITRGGFSDALLQASWRETVTRSSMLHTTIAVSRFQDVGMLDGLSDMRFAWVVFGWKISF
jgi:hypothetical protein